MTRMHFERLAKALTAVRRAEHLDDQQYDGLVDQIALACNEFNPGFKYDRFRKACGFEPD